jgi:hypothetical protein
VKQHSASVLKVVLPWVLEVSSDTAAIEVVVDEMDTISHVLLYYGVWRRSDDHLPGHGVSTSRGKVY